MFHKFGKSLCLKLVTGDGSKKGWVLRLVRQTCTGSEVTNLGKNENKIQESLNEDLTGYINRVDELKGKTVRI